MKVCKSCNINFNTSDKLCPLCQNELEGESGRSGFRKSTRLKTNSIILRILLFVSILIAAVSTIIEESVAGSIEFNLYVYLGLISNFLVVNFMLKNYQNVLRMFANYGFILIILAFLWYLKIRSDIITNYIIPSISLFELLFNFISGLATKGKYLVKYSNIIFMNLLLLLLPIVMVSFGLITNPVLAYVCLGLAAMTIVGLVIFCFEQIKEEFIKVFRI